MKSNDFSFVLEASEPPEPEKVEHESDAKLTYR